MYGGRTVLFAMSLEDESSTAIRYLAVKEVDIVGNLRGRSSLGVHWADEFVSGPDGFWTRAQDADGRWCHWVDGGSGGGEFL